MSQPLTQLEEQHPIVLVIDDNPAIRDMVSWALELDGYEPVEASEGQEALAWLDNAAREGRYPSVILLDLAMPVMDGNAFLCRLRERVDLVETPPAVIVITAMAGPETQALDVQQVIVKPFHVRDLLDIVRKLALPRSPGAGDKHSSAGS